MSKTLFSKNSKDHDEIWDDSLLIQAYEESIKLQKEEVAKELAMKTNTKRRKSENSESETSSTSKEEFKVGDFVRSTYEDGVDYEAEILSISESGCALIRYVGYGNEERVKLEDLIASWGLAAREEQKLLAEADSPTNVNNERDQEEGLHQFVLNKTSGINGKLPIPPMPPMPPAVIDGTRDSEYMSAMLMSWYMSGYYTGLFHGRKEAQQELVVSRQQSLSLESKSPQSKDQQRKKQRKRNLNNRQ